MKTSVLNQIKTLLGMDVKLEQRKMADGVTLIEADAFEMGNEVFVITEDDQKIPVPIGEYEMEDGMIMVVVEEGIIAEYKEAEATEEEVAPEEVVEEEVAAETETETKNKTAPKKTIESIVKETFFSEIEELKNENIELKSQIEKLTAVATNDNVVELAEDVKPISHNPENINPIEFVKYAQNRPRNIMDSILEKINK
jgi:hypothetical protein